MEPIYLDYNATTPIDPEVAGVMRPFLSGIFGNPSSLHSEGVRARKAIENARKQLATLLGCHPDEIIFTSGGSEANNLAIKGAAFALRERGNHIITTSVEHPAVTEVCRHLEKEGFRITWLGVDEFGMVDPRDVQKAITPATILISVMHANNETGTIQPVRQIGEIATAAGILFHADAAQTIGKIRADVNEMKVDLLSVAGHKFYAPKGVGALFIRRGVRLEKLIHGADHEQNLRAGTENVMSVAGLGMAAEIAGKYLDKTAEIKVLRDKMETEIRSAIPQVKMNGHPEFRLPNTLNLSFPGVVSSLLLSRMEGIAASAGAACHSGNEVHSPVLKAMGVPDEYAMGTIRFSLGRMTSEEDIEKAIPLITEAYRSLGGEVGQADKVRERIRLTNYTHSLGCACKIDPAALALILKKIPVLPDSDVLVGFETSDDAAVYRISDDIAIVQTVDLIPPVVDDPYDFGMVAAANALSDIYAMGAEPLFALNIVCFPKMLPVSVLDEILRGALEKTNEAGIPVTGGHSIEDTEPKFGLVVTGRVHPLKILRNTGAERGNVLILTKPLGTGIISTAVKRGAADSNSEKIMVRTMSELNKTAAGVILKYPVTACTDVTGFGLLGHLKEMVLGSECGVRVFNEKIPVLPEVHSYAAAGIIPGGSLNNLKSVEDFVTFDNRIPHVARLILADAQTSGGLLFAVPPGAAEDVLSDLHNAGVTTAAIIGAFDLQEKQIIVQ